MVNTLKITARAVKTAVNVSRFVSVTLLFLPESKYKTKSPAHTATVMHENKTKSNVDIKKSLLDREIH